MLIDFDYLWRRYKIRSTEVLHVGANIGQEAAAYHRHGVTRVIWVEAHKPTFDRLCQHVQQYPGHICLNACVSDTSGEKVKFHLANNACESSSILQLGTHAQRHPTVKYIQDIEMETVTLGFLLAMHQLAIEPGAFLNIDLQGAELPALLGLGERIRQFDHLYLEVNKEELYKGCALVEEVDRYVETFGFVGIETKMTGAGWGDKYYKRI